MNPKTGRIIFGLLLIGLGIWWIWSSQAPKVTVEAREIKVGDATRKFRLVKPVSADTKAKLPLMIALHGAMDTTEEMGEYSQLDRLAGEKHVVVAYLEGRLHNWPPRITEESPDIFEPDIQFFDTVCDQLIREGVDGTRVYVVGVSQGGCMANMLVLKRSQRIAAAVINCGWMPKPLDVVPPNTEHKCPLLFVVGSEDMQVNPEVVRVGYEMFNMASHPVRFEVIRGAGHGWNAAYGVNELMWSFLQNKDNRNAPQPKPN